jgi:hypothetical protein
MAGLTPMFTDAQVRRWTDKFKDRAEDAMLQALIYAGENFVKLAREHGEYRDITGNLRSSIGYVVVKDGQVASENYQQAEKGSDKSTGVQQSRRLARDLALTHNQGFVLIGVAGMDYAVYVENIKNKDVISYAEVETKKELRLLLNKALRKAT